jgi:hypothetical protein
VPRGKLGYGNRAQRVAPSNTDTHDEPIDNNDAYNRISSYERLCEGSCDDDDELYPIYKFV